MGQLVGLVGWFVNIFLRLVCTISVLTNHLMEPLWISSNVPSDIDMYRFHRLISNLGDSSDGPSVWFRLMFHL